MKNNDTPSFVNKHKKLIVVLLVFAFASCVLCLGVILFAARNVTNVVNPTPTVTETPEVTAEPSPTVEITETPTETAKPTITTTKKPTATPKPTVMTPKITGIQVLFMINKCGEYQLQYLTIQTNMSLTYTNYYEVSVNGGAWEKIVYPGTEEYMFYTDISGTGLSEFRPLYIMPQQGNVYRVRIISVSPEYQIIEKQLDPCKP